MAERYQIQMDFAQARRQADELDNIAGNLSKLSKTDLQEMLNGLGNNWKGESADLYIQKGFALKGNIDKTATALRGMASSIRTIAKRIYEAEMEALRIAEEREAEAVRSGNSAGGGGGGRF